MIISLLLIPLGYCFFRGAQALRHRFDISRWRKKLNLDPALAVLDEIGRDVDGFSLSVSARRDADAMDYVYGEICPEAFVAILSMVNANAATVFYDLGSGSGKAVLLAAMVFGVKKSVGIELFAQLNEAAALQLQRLKRYPNYQSQAEQVHFICGDYLALPFADADVVFISATALFGDAWQRLNQRLEELQDSALVITTTKALISPQFRVERQTRAQMSWGVVRVFIHRRVIHA